MMSLRGDFQTGKTDGHLAGDEDLFNSVIDINNQGRLDDMAGQTSTYFDYTSVTTFPNSMVTSSPPGAYYSRGKLERQESELSQSDGSCKQANADLESFLRKKSFAQNMMDIALLSANTNQLRYVIDLGGRHPHYNTSMILISFSLVMQIIVGLLMLYLNSYNMKNKTERKAASALNNVSVTGVFLVTLVNVFISTFNGAAVEVTNPVDPVDAERSLAPYRAP